MRGCTTPARARPGQRAGRDTQVAWWAAGDRSERIRTYNFPQGRVTDHRINLTLYKLGEVLEGGLDAVVAPLIAEYQAEALKNLADEAHG